MTATGVALDAPPPTEADAAAFCDVCGEGYGATLATCADCGVPRRPVPIAVHV
jgi:hypothetical protein